MEPTGLEEEESKFQEPKLVNPFLPALNFKQPYADLKTTPIVVWETGKNCGILRGGWLNQGVYKGEENMGSENVKNSRNEKESNGNWWTNRWNCSGIRTWVIEKTHIPFVFISCSALLYVGEWVDMEVQKSFTMVNYLHY